MSVKFSKKNVIAERGYSSKFPENSLLALEEALKAGVKYVEFDVQTTYDRIPVVLHDHTLERTSTDERIITDITFDHIQDISVHEPDRFDDQFYKTPLPSLEQVVELLKQYPDAMAFVDVKHHSVERFKLRKIVEAIVERLEPVKDQYVLTSLMTSVLKHAKSIGCQRIGWVTGPWDVQANMIADLIEPDYILAKPGRLSDEGPLPKGNWKWVIYSMPSEEDAKKWLGRGAHLVEVPNAPELI